MSRHHQQHLSSPIYHHQNSSNNITNTPAAADNRTINTDHQVNNHQILLSPPTSLSLPTHTRRESLTLPHYQDLISNSSSTSLLPPRAPSLFQPPPPREDTGYRLESRGRIPAIRIPPVPYRRSSDCNPLPSFGIGTSASELHSDSHPHSFKEYPGSSPYEQPAPTLPPLSGVTNGLHSHHHHLQTLPSFGQSSSSSHSHSRSPYAGPLYNLALSNPLSGGSSSDYYSIERGLRSPHPPLTANIHSSSSSHLWPPNLSHLGSSPHSHHTHSHSHSRSPQPNHHHRDSIGSSGRVYYTSTPIDSIPSVPGPSTENNITPYQLRESPYHYKYNTSITSHIPNPPSSSSTSYNRQASPVHIPPPLRFKYSVSPPAPDNQLDMPPRKKATGDTSLIGSSTPRTMSSATGLSGSVTRSGRKTANGKGWTMEHTYDSVGQKKEVIVIDDSTSPMNPPPRKRTRAQVAAEQAQALLRSQESIYNGNINGHGSTSSLSASTKKRKVDESNEQGSAKKAKGKVPSTATSASIQATGQSYTNHVAQPKALPAQKQPAVAPGPPGQSNTQPPWDDAEGHYIVKPDDVVGGKYKIVRLLGQGTFGKVVEARHIETRRKVAIKVIRAVQKYRDASKIEIRVLETLKKNDPRNDNKCIHLDDVFDFRNHPCLVSELYGMSVFDFLKQNSFQPFPEKHIQDFARSLLRSVAFLHQLKLVHTDLKPENILLCSNEARLQGPRVKGAKSKSILRNTEIRLIDFGSATFESEYHSSVVSTRHYRAPEIILGLPWSYPCDMFSIGCILVEFYTGDALFQTHDNLEHLAMMEVVMGKFSHRMIEKGRHKKPEFFRGTKIDFPNVTVSKASKKYVKGMRSLKDIIAPTTKHQQFFLDLCLRLLDHDPDIRLKVQDALRHPYLSEPIPEPA
ncbi:uncharacterized protein IL334_007715 [Kwoniella shivajii]|uniref:Protein kinase domain-containing protein n=1 Tax=Kwoniella shivajii TaxID=564305 RepID=A0ABZ1D9F7_9TREE|nr:hypothetical protein IL334_007715 [Kwoniella shivajii]